MIKNTQCLSCKNTYGGVVQAFQADVKEEWSLFIGEWFTLKCFMGDVIVVRGDGTSPHSPSARVLSSL